MNNLKNINSVYRKTYVITKQLSLDFRLFSNQYFGVTHTFKVVISSKLWKIVRQEILKIFKNF